jgi:uncharacterized 2Fe-2S/4Fe-4S cluster protein (DUF4445 family)
MARTIKIEVHPSYKEIECEKGRRLQDVLREEGYNLESVCGGMGLCGKCKVLVDSESRLPVTSAEKKILSTDEIENGIRLACQVVLTDDLRVFIPHQIGKMENILVYHEEEPFMIDPPVEISHLVIPLHSGRTAQSDAGRIKQAYMVESDNPFELTDLDLVRKIPRIIRERDGRITVYTLQNRCLDIRYGHSTTCYGIALDIGTTTIVASLVDLLTGQTLRTESSENPQIVFGEDVMSRIHQCIISEERLDQLNRLVVERIQYLIENCLEKVEGTKTDIFEITVVGNTTMLHLFLKIFPKYLAISPFVPAITSSFDARACETGILLGKTCNIHILPSVSSFVGADHVGAILASGMYRKDYPSLLIDIGTNTEITLKNKNQFLSCSTPAGPAFEGMNIKYGMRAEKGAIHHMRIEKKRTIIETIGGGTPKGICGTGLIDATAEMLKSGILTTEGTINQLPGFSYIETEYGLELVLWRSKKDVVTISQKDIKEIQLAKAAIYAGISILSRTSNIPVNRIQHLFLAGGFGNFLTRENATIIGLLPEIESRNVKFIGNAALQGAKMALLSKKYREIARKIPERVTYLEISAEETFEDQFIDAFYFPHKNKDLFPESTGILEKLQKSPK